MEEHRHCAICEKVISPDKRVCSKKCEKELEARVGRRRMLLYLFYAGIAIFLFLLLLQIAGWK